ncbi:Lysosomal alpha-mannosidase [Papilio machaon]|uniref:Lysosomal alpha-mannosidase n=1 Tax=Papilio machaon TaxID=76193 RepID=A0A194RQK5_PAPMA|nr:Lysosomal alpha-mannosidase [Papilio machaon]
MDAGWVKTYDEYYYGTRTSVSTANVQLIYHSVLSELLHDKRRKFTFSETVYFWRWWKEQRPATRATFRALVAEGRVEFAGGGWVQNDEATTDYLQIIDQYTWGLRKLNDTLGPCGKPKAAWQVDTYGHTREQASLLAQMGYDGLFIGRVDHKERESMIEEDRMEFMWRGSNVLGKMSDIMTHNLFNLYNAPDGFCFDFLCSDEPIIDDPDSHVYNADARVNDFIAQIERQAKYYDHDNIMVTMGGDFTYQSAANWFMNIDKLINHVTTHPANLSDVNVFYSTPSCYLKAIYMYGRRDKSVFTEKVAKPNSRTDQPVWPDIWVERPDMTSDYLPYGSDSTTYWTGLYTSRPSLKYLARKSHIFLQVVKQLTVISCMGDSYELHLLRHAVSLLLHHDAITGTSQQHVTLDFIRTLTDAVESCSKKVSQYLSSLTPTWGGSRRSKNNQQFIICHQLNMSQCRFSESQDTMLLLVYNPSSIKTYFHVRLPAIAMHYSIRDYNDEEVEYQLIPLPASVINLPGRSSSAIQELCFEAENIPPLGYTAYYLAPIRDPLEESSFVKKTHHGPEADQELTPNISNEYLKVTIDKETGLLESIQHVDGVKVQISQNFYYYSQVQQPLQSGAYSFRPSRNRPTPVSITYMLTLPTRPQEKVIYHAVRGSLIKEIRQRFSDWVTQVIRLYRGEEFIELEWIIGPIPVGNDLGKEVVSILKTNISNGGEFYTDANSRQMMKRNCWNESTSHQVKKPVAACYYPVTSRICLRANNASVELCVLTDRAQGGTSYSEGEIELMVHRRLLTDDGFGLEETLNEEAYGVGLVVKGKHRIMFGNYRQEMDEQTFSERVSYTARKWLMEPWLFLAPGEKINRRKWQNVRNKRYSAVRLHGLPRHIHVITLEPWKAGSVLLRLENTLENSDKEIFKMEKDTTDESPRTTHIVVDLRKIFGQHEVRMVRETTLAANQWLEEARQMDWSTRYVYSGGDDGILPEDNVDYTDDKLDRTERKDSEFTQEDTYFVRKQPRKKINVTPKQKTYKSRYKYDERRKRSLNITENMIETVNEANASDSNAFITQVETTTKPYKETTSYDEVETKNNSIIPTDFRHIAFAPKPDLSGDLLRTRFRADSKKSPKINYNHSRVKPMKFFVEWGNCSEEVGSTEDENFSSNLKKRSARRRNGSHSVKTNRRNGDFFSNEPDDGITRSMYEMYYKIKPANNLKPRPEPQTPAPRRFKKIKGKKIRIDKHEELSRIERTTRKSRRNRNKRKGKTYATTSIPLEIYNTKKRITREKQRQNADSGQDNDSEAENTKTFSQLRKAQFTHMAPKTELAHLRAKRRKEAMRSYLDYEADTSDGAEEESREEGDKWENTRRKRTVSKEEEMAESSSDSQESNESEFVVTLRPSQIRTFVIWFVDNRKTYTL